MLQSSISLAGSSLLLLLLFAFISHSTSSLLIVPQEVPSVLSLVYSNIPQVRKGTDSRFGFGFRLGEHADFQVLLELGPQKDTQPLGNQDSDNSLSKRQLSKQEQRKALLQQQRKRWHDMTSTERMPSNWLESWSQGLKTNNNNNKNNKKQTKKQKATEVQNDKAALVPTMPVMPELALKQFQLLHKMATTTSTTTSSTTITPKPFAGGPLNLGGPAGFTVRPVELLQPSQLLEMINPRKTKSEISADLMNVSLDDGA